MMLQIYHQRHKCIGCNACVEVDKGRWRISRKDGKSILIGGKSIKGIYRTTVGNDEVISVMKAVKNCPLKIIKTQKL